MYVTVGTSIFSPAGPPSKGEGLSLTVSFGILETPILIVVWSVDNDFVALLFGHYGCINDQHFCSPYPAKFPEQVDRHVGGTGERRNEGG